MRVKGRAAREGGPELVAILAAAAALALTAVVAWPTRSLISTFLRFLTLDYLTPFKYLSAWGTLMAMIALTATMVDGIVALIADIKGRGNKAQTTSASAVSCHSVLLNEKFLRHFILNSGGLAIMLFLIGYLFHAHVL